MLKYTSYMPDVVNRHTGIEHSVCPPVADVFGDGPDAVEMMGWPDAALDVRDAADTVVAVAGWGEHPNQAQNALDHFCGNCALQGCGVKSEIVGRAAAHEELRASMAELAYSADTQSFIRMAPLEVMREVNKGEPLHFPEGSLPPEICSEDVVLPSARVVTPMGNEAVLTPLYAANPKLNAMLQSTIGSLPEKQRGAVFGKAQEVLVRAVDTEGSLGVHHINDTVFGRPVYYNLDRVVGRPVVYLAGVGTMEDGALIYGILTATTTPKEQLQLVDIVGGNTNRKRFKRT